jgi:hypothetical protein
MPTVNFYPAYSTQEGFANSTVPETFQRNAFGSNSIVNGRSMFVRFTNVDIPPGATITSASITYKVNVKVQTDPNSFDYTYYYQQQSAGDTDQMQDTLPLRVGVQEDTVADRVWGTVSTGTYNWTIGGDQFQDFIVSVTARMQNVFTTNTGRHCNLVFRFLASNEVGDVAIGSTPSGRPPVLSITYTGGTAPNEEVSVNENPNFAVLDGTKPQLYDTNSFFGTFSSASTYSTIASDGAITPPGGGNMCKITATETKNVALHMRPLECDYLTPGEWYTWSWHVYVPSAVTSRVNLSTLPALGGPDTNLKDQWVRLSHSMLVGNDQSFWVGVATTDPITSGQFIYVANVNVTRGQGVMPYFDGQTTDSATFHRTFEWGGGTQGKRNGGIAYCVMDATPTITLSSPQRSGNTYDGLNADWTFNPTYSEAQQRYRVEFREKNPR